MYGLLNFFSKTKYAEDFIKGKLYLNSLQYFKLDKEHIGTPLTELKKHNSLYDCYEGSIFGLKNERFAKMFPNYISRGVKLDPVIDVNEFEFCHLLCFYRVDFYFNKNNGLCFELPQKNTMIDFGTNVAIIMNPNELMERINKAITKSSDSVIYNIGNVRYRYPTFNGNPLYGEDKHLLKSSLIMHLCGYDSKTDENTPAISDVRKLLQNSEESYSYRDCFVKMKNFENQKEWRVCIYDSSNSIWHTTEGVVLDVGDLSDIVKLCNVNSLYKTVDKLNYENKLVPIDVHINTFFGNISRKDFTNRIIDYNPGCGFIFSFC